MRALALIAMTACSGGRQIEVAPSDKPAAKLEPVKDALCVTRGTAAIGGKITEPTVRAIAPGTSGDAAAMTFTFRGDSDTIRELASGQARRQLGLKLRAQNGCNLVYVMWRLDPKPKLEVSIKSNPGAVTQKDCGANGYTKLKPATSSAIPELVAGGTHTLRAEISGDELLAWIDDTLSWRGILPDTARSIVGPSGLRSDNLAFDLVELTAPSGTPAECKKEHGD